MTAVTTFVSSFPQVNGIPVELGSYTATSVDTAKKQADMTIESANGGSFTINVKNGVVLSGRGVKAVYSNGSYEVTAAKLKQLQSKYNVVPNF